MIKNSVKLLVVIAVVVLVAGVYYIKNSSKPQQVAAGVVESEKATAPAEKPEKEVDSKDGDSTDSEASKNESKNNKEVKKPEEKQGEDSQKDFDLYADSTIDLDRLKGYGLPIILVFGSEDCIYCVKMKPDLTELNTEYKEKAIIKYVDLVAAPDFWKLWPIQGTPALIYINADGTAYKPVSEDIGNLMYYYKNQNTDEHALTMSYGMLDRKALESILGEMLNAQ